MKAVMKKLLKCWFWSLWYGVEVSPGYLHRRIIHTSDDQMQWHNDQLLKEGWKRISDPKEHLLSNKKTCWFRISHIKLKDGCVRYFT